MSSDQPLLRRLLGIQCLLRATEEAEFMGSVLRSLSTLSEKSNLERLVEDLKEDFKGIPDAPIHRLVYVDGELAIERPSDEGNRDGFNRDEDNGGINDDNSDDAESLDVFGRKKILSTHIRGEAYELLCAMMFKCKMGSSSTSLSDYHAENASYRQQNDRKDPQADVGYDALDVEDVEDEDELDRMEIVDRLGFRDCHVTRVFLSEGTYTGHEVLRWCDNREKWDSYVEERLKPYLLERARRHCSRGGTGSAENQARWRKAQKQVEDIAEKFRDNVTSDLGFDLLVELEEEPDAAGEAADQAPTDSVALPQRHFILAQCKYRSSEHAEVSMAGYVGKYYNIVHIMERYNDLVGGRRTLLPFFWMSTVTNPDAMKYFTQLRDAGKIRFYSNESFDWDDKAVNVIENTKEQMRRWKKECVDSEAAAAAFRHRFREPRQARDHQKRALDDMMSHCKAERSAGMTVETMGVECQTRAALVMATGSGKTFTSFLSVRRLEQDEQLCMTRDVKEREMAASLHFSPMIRLVIQNAHEWLSDERSFESANNVPERERKIYYCICSMHDNRAVLSGGCTAVRIIDCGALLHVFRYHKKTGTLHRCRFFTTYQASKTLHRIVRRINLHIYKRLPSSCLFGISVFDEAHQAVGNGSKAFSVALLINARISLSFTASAIYSFYHLKRALPQTFGKYEGVEKELQKDSQTYMTVENTYLFPQITAEDAETARSPAARPPLYTDLDWSPADTLDEDLLFVECTNDRCAALSEQGLGLTWKDFEELAKEEGSSIVVFIIDDQPVLEDFYSVAFDSNGEPRYIGVVPNRCDEYENIVGQGEGRVSFAVGPDTKCFGMNASGTKLFRPRGAPVGFFINDFSSIGVNNKIGPVVHKLSYNRAFVDGILVRPRVVMMTPNPIELDSKDHGYWNLIFGGSEDFETGDPKDPASIHWTLTIHGSPISAREHQFRAMKLLKDMYVTDTIKRTLVFCRDTEESKVCRFIFISLWRAEMTAREHQGEQLYDVHTDYIFSTATDASDQSKETMAYSEQQGKLSVFASKPRAVLFNVKLISIGVDLPSVDTVMVVNPSFTQSDVTQKIGRALRRDPNDPSKVATVIIPAWSRPLTSSREDSAGGIDHGLGADTDLPNPDLWYPPIHPSFEDTFAMTLKVVDAMMDDSITMVTSYNETSRTKRDAKGGSKASKRHVHEILTKLKGNAPPAEVPVFDEWFSASLLAAWRPQILTFEDGNVGPSALHRTQLVEQSINRLRGTSSAFIIVAFVSFCHQCAQKDENTSWLWYPGKKPFDREQPVHLKFEDDACRESLLGLFELDKNILEEVIKTKNGNNRDNKSMKSDFDKLDPESVTALVDGFLENLRGDIGLGTKNRGANVHRYALRALCNSSKELICNDSHGDHSVQRFFGSGDELDFDQFERGFRDFLENHAWLKARRSLKTPNSKTSTDKKSSTGKKRVQNKLPEARETGKHEIEADFGSMSLDPEEGAASPPRADLTPAYSPTTLSLATKRVLFRRPADE